MVAKGISQDDFMENGVGRRSNRSFWMRTMTVSGSFSNTFASEGSPIFLPTRSVVYFQEQQVLF